MAQPKYATVIYRVQGTHTVAPTLGTMEQLKAVYDTHSAHAEDRVQVWAGRYWSTVTGITVTGVAYPVKSITTSNGANFIGTIGAIGNPVSVPASKVIGNGTFRDIAPSAAVDVSFNYAEVEAAIANPNLTYKKISGTLSANSLPLADELVYRMTLDSTDSVYWTGGLLVKADG